ncbi:hypothetical protein SLEP1_g11108 [Rubroshorea leprosula]|uniref:Uncharacterized protein n=1 Tax=Rubroshorea leprosula TaxID=152421 RepID=A0AAV5IKC0_9ROSI|nr:hypothetical protein SLEP1_g11108 [Rubroshorea leprosula]
MEKNHTSKSYPMVGEGLHSYATNSGHQTWDVVPDQMHFFVVQYIIEDVKSVSQSKDIAFEVFFNDHSANDFDTLFRTLPVERNSFAAGLPIPEQVQDKTSTTWNKGRISYGTCKKVEDAFSAQFAYDFESFLKARAIEIVPGGFMALPIPCITTKVKSIALLELLASSLGLVEEATVDSFNIPFYLPSPEEVESIVKKNGCFKIEKMQGLPRSITTVEEFILLFSQKLAEFGIFSYPSTAYETMDLFTFLKRTSE